MATTTSYREQFAADTITVLKTIKTANGYRTQVSDSNISRSLKSPDEMDSTNDFPALFVVSGSEENLPITNREIQSTYNIIIYGYVRFNPDGASDTIADQQLNELIADTKEAIMNSTNILWSSSVGPVIHITTVDTDEGSLEPDAIFKMNVQILFEHRHNNTGSLVDS